MSQKTLFIKIMECEGLLDAGYKKPFVSVTLINQNLKTKNTKIFSGKGADVGNKILKFEINDTEHDWLNVQVKNKRTFEDQWIGDLPLKLGKFYDGEVHESWYKLEKGYWRYTSREAVGYIHLAIQVLDTVSSRYETPFADHYGKISFEEWISSEEARLAESQRCEEAFGLKYPTIHSAVRMNYIHDCASKIQSKNRTFSREEIDEMKDSTWKAWLHKGNLEKCIGKRYMVAVDGSISSTAAFDNLLRTITDDDHVFIVTARKFIPDVVHKTVVQNEIRKAAIDIVSRYEAKIKSKFPSIEYSTLIPLAYDPRRTVSNLAKGLNVDVLVIGKHTSRESFYSGSGYFRSFTRFCQGHAGCTVMIFGSGGNLPVDSPAS